MRMPKSWVAGLIAVCLWLGMVPARAADEVRPLPSWNDGPARKAILEFVDRVTQEGGPEHVPPAGRIAVFDTPDCEIGVRTGWGISRDAASFFSNVGLGLRF